jgi:trehalose/maltose hydrolase-like predicted phosphorylase
VYEVQAFGDKPIDFKILRYSGGEQSPDINFANVPTDTPTKSRAITGKIREPELGSSTQIEVTVIYPNFFNSGVATVHLDANQTFSYPVIVTCNLEEGYSLKAANQLWNTLAASSSLKSEHILEWSRVWSSGLEVQGDLHLARALNSSLYYILSSIRDDWDYSLSPGSLSSDAYHGHVFWDMETWMYPNLLSLYPKLAQSGLRYRYQRFEEARAKAKSYNPPYEGIMYPWESAFTGAETCPTVAATGLLEQHISGDVVFAARQYYYSEKTTKEEQETIWELVYGVAEFYASRCVKRQDGLYGINGIIPPDEYAENVNNSIYTNVIAQITFEFAIELAKEFGKSVPTEWQTLSENLFMPKKGDLHLEYEGYDGRKIKQADVVLLGYPLLWKGMTLESRRADLLFYENVTDEQGPAMTWGMHSIGFLELDGQDTDKSYRLFNKSYANVKDPYFVWTESPSGGAINFITGAGGFLQTYLNGYGTYFRHITNV